MATPPLLIPNLALNSIGLVQLVGLWVVVSIQSEHVHGVVTPDQPRHAGWSVHGVVTPDQPSHSTQLLDIFAHWDATFDQPPLSFPLPSWDLMIPHGSGQRMTRKHSSSPIVAGGNSGGKPHG